MTASLLQKHNALPGTELQYTFQSHGISLSRVAIDVGEA